MKTNHIQIAIADDDLLFVELLKRYIEEQAEMEVTFTAKNGNEFLDNHEAYNIDVLILDLRMNNGNGMEVMETLLHYNIDMKIIVLSSFYRRSFIGQMLKLGANAFLPKEIDPDELMQIIAKVHEYGHYFSEEQVTVMRKQLAAKIPQFHLPQKDGLTKRELDILQLLCQQLTTKQIADKLFISPKTVETHKSNLIVKTGVKNTAGLIIYAVQNKIIDANELLLLDR